MKTVFNSSELAHVWAKQLQHEGKAGSFYFKGKTIYSYGSHFPIATIEGNNVLFTTHSYSNTTANHISRARQAVSHLNFIYCMDVPVSYNDTKSITATSHVSDHERNFNNWKKNIQNLFGELGNKKIRNVQDRINSINHNIDELNKYASFFNIKVTDKELQALIKLASLPNFVEQARDAKEALDKAKANIMKKAVKAYSLYIDLWRKFDSEAITNLDSKTKELCNYYSNNAASYTRLRLNEAQNRLETSKGVQIPVEVAKRAFTTLNGCFMTNCKDLSIPVMGYEITESTKDYIKAGCHTIPNEDVKYIAQLLNW